MLETPTRLATTVVAEPADGLVVGPVHLAEDEVTKLAGLTYPELRDALADCRSGPTTSSASPSSSCATG